MVSYESVSDVYKATHRHDSLDKALEMFDEFTHPDNQTHLYNNVFRPAHDDLYQAFAEQLDSDFENDNSSLHKKKSELEKAVTVGLKKFFEKAHPNILTDDFDDLEDKQQYEILVGQYNNLVGDGKIKGAPRIDALIGLAKDKDATVGIAKQTLSSMRDGSVKGMIQKLSSDYFNAHVGTYQAFEIGDYLKPKIEEAGFEVDDPVAWSQLDLQQLLEYRSKLITGKDIEDGKVLKKKKSDE